MDKVEDEEYDKVCFKEYSKVCSEIIDGFLFLSGQDVASNLEILKANGITHIVNAAGEICECYFPDKIEYLPLNLRDNSNEVSLYFYNKIKNIECCFYDAYSFIEKAKEKGGKVLIHCIQGISRSTTLVLSYLILSRKLTYEQALKHVEERRKIVSPNLGFSLQAQTFYQRVYEGYDSLKYTPKIFGLGFISATSDNVVCRFVSLLLKFILTLIK